MADSGNEDIENQSSKKETNQENSIVIIENNPENQPLKRASAQQDVRQPNTDNSRGSSGLKQWTTCEWITYSFVAVLGLGGLSVMGGDF